ncbi:DNA polymerase I [Paenibacillus gansuensis]|uniref:DNA polymerase I n=1 Tax=Paenibacillus gansuensis TaxID=306542 RepID=A0ABW5PDK4_9BACL
MEKLVLIDGNSIAYRAFFALPPLSNSSGLHTNAVYGFTTMLLRLIDEQKPTHFLVAFDAGKVTFRHEGYQEYKGGREKTPSELSEQFPVIKDLLRAFGISQYQLEGYEADDIIGTMTRIADEQKKQVVVVTGDKDMLQLASEQVTIALTRKGISEVELYDPAFIQEKYGLTPDQIIDLKGLMGDTSDNIPGIPGVGEKTALKLLHEYGSVEQVLEHVEDMKGKMKDKIRDHAEDARMSKRLATIHREVPMEADWNAIRYEGYQPETLSEMFRKLEFKSLLERLDLPQSAPVNEVEKEELQIHVVGEEGLEEFRPQLERVTSVHVEAYGENPHTASLIGAGFHTGDGQAYYISAETLLSGKARFLQEWFADETRAKTIFDAHYAEVVLAWKGITLAGVGFDTQLAAYLLDPTETNYEMSEQARKYGLPAVGSDESVYGKGAKYRLPELGLLAEHIGRKAATAHKLAEIQRRELEKNEMNRLFYDLELPLSKLLADMELKGIRVDVEGLKKYGEELSANIESLQNRIYELAGGPFNINSPRQMGEILFEKLDLPVIKKTKTGYSTDAEVLEKLEPYHEIVRQILLYRTLAKLQSTYVEGLLKEVRPETGKIHTYYRQTIAATGRLSSQFPNLQNIPIRLEEGRKIRKVFTPSEEGWLILAADYSQIELRVLAHISQDKNLMEAFTENMDIHTKTAMDVFGVSESEVDANMRRSAKAVNFGIVYGISEYGLSQNLNITRKDAGKFIEQYFEVFQGVRRYMDEIVKQARNDGYVKTLLERRRYLPEIKASNFNIRSFAERTAMNTPIQGTAADIIKLAMVRVAERLRQEKLRSRMLLQVHDELVFEVPEEELELMKKLVPEEMEKALELNVPLKADVSYGQNWQEAK